MKKLNKNIHKELDQIINHSRSNEEVKTSAFFTTRVMGKVEQLDDKKDILWGFNIILKPVFVLIIIVNIANFYFFNNSENKTTDSDSSEQVFQDYVAWNSDFILYEESESSLTQE